MVKQHDNTVYLLTVFHCKALFNGGFHANLSPAALKCGFHQRLSSVHLTRAFHESLSPAAITVNKQTTAHTAQGHDNDIRTDELL